MLPLALLRAGAAMGEGWDASIEAGAELRLFPNQPQFEDQNDTTLSPSLSLRSNFTYEWDSGDRLSVTPFARWDADDDERTHADLREANWLHVGDGWDLVVGLGQVFWGVTESRHLVDIINQTDLVEDIDEEDKLGQPMVNLNLSTEAGAFSLFALPGFRERTFPAGEARLRGVLPVATDDPSYESGSKDRHVDVAARWSRVFGDVDVGVSHFHGTSREPRFLLDLDDPSRPVLRPRYDLIDQTGLDLQFTRDAWLGKLEAITRSGQGPRFAAAVGGFEYTLYGILGTSIDLGLLGEFLYDGRDEDEAPPTIADNDLFAGTRLALNDVQSTEALVGAIVDAKTGATALSLEAERRLGANWKVELEGRVFSHVPDDDFLLRGVRDDDYVSLRLTRFFSVGGTR